MKHLVIWFKANTGQKSPVHFCFQFLIYLLTVAGCEAQCTVIALLQNQGNIFGHTWGEDVKVELVCAIYYS
jgi:hypothetical protein